MTIDPAKLPAGAVEAAWEHQPHTERVIAAFLTALLEDDEAVGRPRDRIAWAMLVVSGEQSPRKAWAESADEWREKADGVFASALLAAVQEADRG